MWPTKSYKLGGSTAPARKVRRTNGPAGVCEVHPGSRHAVSYSMRLASSGSATLLLEPSMTVGVDVVVVVALVVVVEVEAHVVDVVLMVVALVVAVVVMAATGPRPHLHGGEPLHVSWSFPPQTVLAVPTSVPVKKQFDAGNSLSGRLFMMSS